MQILHKDTLHDALLYATDIFSRVNDDGSPFIPAFLSEYVRKNLLPADKIKHIGKWEIEKFGLFVPEVGAVNSREEGFNAVLKRFQNHQFQEFDGVLATLDKISHYYWLENQKSKAGIGKYKVAEWAKPFFGDIDPYALKISDIKNPDEFVTELLKSRGKESPPNSVPISGRQNATIIDTAPKDVFIDITDAVLVDVQDILSDITPTGLNKDLNNDDAISLNAELMDDDIPAQVNQVLIDLASSTSNIDLDQEKTTSLNADLIDLVGTAFNNIEDIPFVMNLEAEDEVNRTKSDEAVDDLLLMGNFDEEVEKPLEPVTRTQNLDDLVEITSSTDKELEATIVDTNHNKSFEDPFDVVVDSNFNESFHMIETTEPPADGPVDTPDLDPELEVLGTHPDDHTQSKKRKAESVLERNTRPRTNVTDIDDTKLEEVIVQLKGYEKDLRYHIEKMNEPKIEDVLYNLLDVDVNLVMIISNTIGQLLTKLRKNYAGRISKTAGRLCNRWKKILLISSSEEQIQATLKAKDMNWICKERADTLLNDNCSEPRETEENSSNGVEAETEVGRERNTVEENHLEVVGSIEESVVEGNESEEADGVDNATEIEIDRTTVEETYEEVVGPIEDIVEENEPEVEENNEEQNVRSNEVSEVNNSDNEEPLHSGRVPGRLRMKDLPDNLVTKCGRAKICVDEGRVSRVQNKFTGTVCYNIEEGNRVFIVKSRISDKKVEFECSCSVTGHCTSFHVEAVKYFTTGSMSGATLKPNMRKLGWMKKKANKKELAGKKPTKFNSTKFYELQNNLRDKESTLLQFEVDKESTEEEPLAEILHDDNDVDTLSCRICGKKSNSEKGLKIHKTKAHGGEEDYVKTLVSMCKVCGLRVSSERILENHMKKSHTSDQLNQKTDLNCDHCDKTFISSKGLKIHVSKSH